MAAWGTLGVMQATATIDEGQQRVILGARIEHAQGVSGQDKETTGVSQCLRWRNVWQSSASSNLRGLAFF